MNMTLLYVFILLVEIALVIFIISKIRKFVRKKPNIWVDNIEQTTMNNDDWRRVLYNSDNMQVVAMSVPQGQDLGMEKHATNDQFFRIESGVGKLETMTSDGQKTQYDLQDGYSSVVPHNTWHNLINTGDKPLKLYTIYSPPHHRPGLIQHTKQEEIIHH